MNCSSGGLPVWTDGATPYGDAYPLRPQRAHPRAPTLTG